MKLSFPQRVRIAAAAVAAVALVGSLAAVGPASAAPTAPPAPPRAAVTLSPGSSIELAESKADSTGGFKVLGVCTLGWIVRDGSGKLLGLTAGHCGTKGNKVGVGSTLVGTITRSTGTPPKIGKPSGDVVYTTLPFRPPYSTLAKEFTRTLPQAGDWALIQFEPGVKLAPNAGQAAAVRAGRAMVGDRVCQKGNTTGWKCGTVRGVYGRWILTDIQARPGDSGSPLIRTRDRAAVGLASSIIMLEPKVKDGQKQESNEVGVVGTNSSDLLSVLAASGTSLA